MLWLKDLLQKLSTHKTTYSITSDLLLRALGFIYAIVFLIIFFQGLALWGKNGLLPIQETYSLQQLLLRPSLFYFFDIDQWLKPMAALGLACSALMLWGRANIFILMVVWLIQLSLVNSGQLFYGYGWEILILEVTFFCFFLVPPFNFNPRISIWFLRWTLFRLMFGAGMIKIRGDDCWRDLTCLFYHYETQPNPHPVSYFYHQMPAWFHYAGTLFNHFVELIVPFGYFGPKKIRHIAAFFTIVFQLIIISSGNLSWLNWLTLILAIVLFDDSFWLKLGFSARPLISKPLSNIKISLSILMVALGAYLSWPAALNLVSQQQRMNSSYDSWHLINSYGAFGSISKERFEVIIKGTNDSQISPQTTWLEYQLPCAPSDMTRRPCLITPYHYHIDWQMWFSGMRPVLQEEWLFRMGVRLLEGDPEILKQFSFNPFPNQPPKFLKMDLYKYQFADFKDWPKSWWTRQYVSEYLPPVSLQTPLVQKFAKDK